jgi:galactose mutarotase-like enzyme
MKTEGLSAAFLQENGGICFECHHVPNSINFNPSIAPILTANSTRISKIEYTFKEPIHENI